jgi:hypothetical protein
MTCARPTRSAASSTRSTPTSRGRAVQVDPIKPALKAPGSKGLELISDAPLSNCAFKFNLRRYSVGRRHEQGAVRRRAVQVDPTKPALKAPGTLRLIL